MTDDREPGAATPRRRRVVAIVSNLFFATRIEETGHAIGVAVERPAHALDACRAAPPDLVVLDLHAPRALDLARALKSDPNTSAVPIVAFYPHVERGLREEAVATGIEHVLPRSAFTARLPELMSGVAHGPRGPSPS